MQDWGLVKGLEMLWNFERGAKQILIFNMPQHQNLEVF